MTLEVNLREMRVQVPGMNEILKEKDVKSLVTKE